jgi:hypothetical protein
MLDTDDTATKAHYICQTYVQQGRGLKVDKLLQYTSAAQAEDRARREAERDGCAGADAYMLTEDTGSGEVSLPTFLARFGDVPLDDVS